MDQTISDADIMRAREDPRFRQILLARSLDQLLSSLHRMQRAAGALAPQDALHLRRGAMMAVELADRIRAIDDYLRRAASAPKLACTVRQVR
jgi:hypothetical protein